MRVKRRNRIRIKCVKNAKDVAKVKFVSLILTCCIKFDYIGKIFTDIMAEEDC